MNVTIDGLHLVLFIALVGMGLRTNGLRSEVGQWQESARLYAKELNNKRYRYQS